MKRALVCWHADGMIHYWVAEDSDEVSLETAIASIVKVHGATDYWLQHEEEHVSKAFAWSFSALDMFEVCKKKYYHIRVAKSHKDADNSAAADGKFIHDAMYQRVIHGKPLPITLRQHEAIAARFAAADGEKHGEMRLALNDKFEPRDYFAKDVWVRVVIDLLIVKGTTATLCDWKTGKKKDRFDQLKLSAAVLSRYMPEITEFKLAFIWLKDSDISLYPGKDDKPFTKDSMKAVWLEYLPRVQEIKKAMATTEFPATEGPLCGWCPVTSCPHWVDRSEL